ncbi:MAG: hypothetical protein ABW162_06255 [Candidatus Sedimenticola sp. PURPLELP]
MNYTQISRTVVLGLMALLPLHLMAIPPTPQAPISQNAMNTPSVTDANVTLRIPYDFKNLDDLNRWRSDYGKKQLTKIAVTCKLYAGSAILSDNKIGEETIYYKIGTAPKGTLSVNLKTKNNKLPDNAFCKLLFIDENGSQVNFSSAIEESGLAIDFTFKSEYIGIQH